MNVFEASQTAQGTAGNIAFATARPATPGEIESLRSEIDRYAATIDELAARLNPVLKPDYGEPSETLSHPMPVMSDIAVLRSHLAANTSHLQAPLGRVDL